tara:strand:- start:206 stop:565 length:360 start_codon:yes stop_codon:yes gene_type:complete
MEDEITTYSAGAILDCIPDVIKDKCMSELVIKTNGEDNQRGGVSFVLTIDEMSLGWEIIHTWGDLFQITYYVPEGIEINDEYSDDLPYIEEITNGDLTKTFDDLLNYLLNKDIEEIQYG